MPGPASRPRATRSQAARWVSRIVATCACRIASEEYSRWVVITRTGHDPGALLISGTDGALWKGLAFLGFLQITAALLNLLPIPGLDGYAAIEPWLSAQNAKGFEPFKPFGILFVFGLLQIDRLNALFFGWVYDLYALSGASPYLSGVGYSLLQFWKLPG